MTFQMKADEPKLQAVRMNLVFASWIALAMVNLALLRRSLKMDSEMGSQSKNACLVKDFN